MLEKFGIKKFIEYKKTVEKERPILTVEPRIITIDGVDGAGKSSIAQKIFESLQRQYGESSVIIANKLIGPEQKRLQKLINDKNLINKKQIDNAYSAMINRIYKEVVIPAVRAGKIVIIDRSELDILRYAIEGGEKELIEKRKKQIQDGTLTHRLWAGNRIFIKANIEDIEHNLSQRMQVWPSDPKTRDEIEKRINAEKEAEKEIISMSCEGEVNVIKKENKRQDDPKKREIYLEKLAEEIIDELNLTNKEK
jgi:thymidylate kinase